MMMDLKSDAISFGLGLLLGVIPTYLITKYVCEQEKEEEIESVKERYAKKDWEAIKRDAKKSAEEKTEKDTQDLKNLLRNEGYVAKPKVAVTEPSENKITEIQVITEDEFGENMEYDTVQLTYNSDTDTLFDELDEIIDDRRKYVGNANLKKLSRGTDAIYFRNDNDRTYYEILLRTDVKTHSEE